MWLAAKSAGPPVSDPPRDMTSTRRARRQRRAATGGRSSLRDESLSWSLPQCVTQALLFFGRPRNLVVTTGLVPRYEIPRGDRLDNRVNVVGGRIRRIIAARRTTGYRLFPSIQIALGLVRVSVDPPDCIIGRLGSRIHSTDFAHAHLANCDRTVRTVIQKGHALTAVLFEKHRASRDPLDQHACRRRSGAAM